MRRVETAVFCVGYLLFFLLTAAWFDRMDGLCRPDGRGSIVKTLGMAAIWPVTLPVGMFVVGRPDGRWPGCLPGGRG